MIHSLQDWWSLAGVDRDYSDLPSALLAPGAAAPAPVAEAALAVTERSPEPAEPERPAETLPPAHADFVAWLAGSPDLAEADWSRLRVLPEGVLEPEVMVVSAMPEKTGHGAAALFSPPHRALLDRMLAAIGCDSQNSYLATIAVAPSITGRIDENHWIALKTRLLHHIGLVRPRRIICFGDTTAKILCGDDLLSARKNKLFINHGSATTEAIVTFHPRTLLERPLFKAEAWKDLQMLTRIDAP